MKLTGETKLLLGIIVFAALGAGILYAMDVRSRPPAPPGPPIADVKPATFDELTENARHAKGREDAPFTIVEFSDFECSSCRRAHEMLAPMLGSAIDARLYFRHYPLEMHQQAIPAALASEAAARQGRFWEMHDALMEGGQLGREAIEKEAQRLGLDLAQFRRDLDDPQMQQLVRADMTLAQRHGVSSTPTFFIRDPDGNVTKAVGLSALMKALTGEELQFPGGPPPGMPGPPGGPPGAPPI